jgi:hypothetical protein
MDMLILRRFEQNRNALLCGGRPDRHQKLLGHAPEFVFERRDPLPLVKWAPTIPRDFLWQFLLFQRAWIQN